MTVLRRKAAVALAWVRLQLGHAVAGLAVFLLEKSTPQSSSWSGSQGKTKQQVGPLLPGEFCCQRSRSSSHPLPSHRQTNWPQLPILFFWPAIFISGKATRPVPPFFNPYQPVVASRSEEQGFVPFEIAAAGYSPLSCGYHWIRTQPAHKLCHHLGARQGQTKQSFGGFIPRQRQGKIHGHKVRRESTEVVL